MSNIVPQAAKEMVTSDHAIAVTDHVESSNESGLATCSQPASTPSLKPSCRQKNGDKFNDLTRLQEIIDNSTARLRGNNMVAEMRRSLQPHTVSSTNTSRLFPVPQILRDRIASVGLYISGHSLARPIRLICLRPGEMTHPRLTPLNVNSLILDGYGLLPGYFGYTQSNRHDLGVPSLRLPRSWSEADFKRFIHVSYPKVVTFKYCRCKPSSHQLEEIENVSPSKFIEVRLGKLYIIPKEVNEIEPSEEMVDAQEQPPVHPGVHSTPLRQHSPPPLSFSNPEYTALGYTSPKQTTAVVLPELVSSALKPTTESTQSTASNTQNVPAVPGPQISDSKPPAPVSLSPTRTFTNHQTPISISTHSGSAPVSVMATPDVVQTNDVVLVHRSTSARSRPCSNSNRTNRPESAVNNITSGSETPQFEEFANGISDEIQVPRSLRGSSLTDPEAELVIHRTVLEFNEAVAQEKRRLDVIKRLEKIHENNELKINNQQSEECSSDSQGRTVGNPTSTTQIPTGLVVDDSNRVAERANQPQEIRTETQCQEQSNETTTVPTPTPITTTTVENQQYTESLCQELRRAQLSENEYEQMLIAQGFPSPRPTSQIFEDALDEDRRKIEALHVHQLHSQARLQNQTQPGNSTTVENDASEESCILCHAIRNYFESVSQNRRRARNNQRQEEDEENPDRYNRLLMQMRENARWLCPVDVSDNTPNCHLRFFSVSKRRENHFNLTGPAVDVINFVRGAFNDSTLHFTLSNPLSSIADIHSRDVLFGDVISNVFMEDSFLDVTWENLDEVAENVSNNLSNTFLSPSNTAQPRPETTNAIFPQVNQIFMRDLAGTILRSKRPNLVDVDLTKPWESWVNRPSSFNLRRRTSVKLINVDGSSMGAIDEGGPSRQFLTNLMTAIASLEVFIGDMGHKILTTNYKCLDERTYYHIGAAIALVLTTGGPAPTFLGPITASILARGMSAVKGTMTIADLRNHGNIDPKLVESFRRIQTAENLEQLQTVIMELEMVAMAGYGGFVARDLNKDKAMLLDAVIHYVVVGRHGWAYWQLVEGMGHIKTIIGDNPTAFEEMCQGVPFSANQLMKQLMPLKNRDLKHREQERTLCWFRQFILKVGAGEITDMNLGLLVEAITGLRNRQVSDRLIEVKFADSKLPRFNTCAESITLPIIPNSYEDFEHSLCFGTLGSRGLISDQP